MFSSFKDFIISILSLVQGLFDAIEPNLSIFVGFCIIFLVALAVKRGVFH